MHIPFEIIHFHLAYYDNRHQ